jgi:hypothetical protein
MTTERVRLGLRSSIRTLAFVGWTVLAAAGASAAALVTDVQGQASLDGGARLALLAEVEPGARFALASGARLTLLVLETGEQFGLKGPGRFELRGSAVAVIEGAQPVKRMLPVEGLQPLRVRPGEMAQATLVLRSIRQNDTPKPSSPRNTRVIDTRPSFRWAAAEGATGYRFALTDAAGQVIHEAQTTATEVSLPAGVELKEGVAYSWSVEALPVGKRPRLAWSDFAVVSAAERSALTRLRPAEDAAFADRVAYALALDQCEAREAAQAQWRRLAAERPNDARLREKAGQ